VLTESSLTPPQRPPATSTPLLAGEGLTKCFGDLLANTEVNIDLHAGEVHVVLGENGAGKSTLLKMLYGVHLPDHGQLSVAGQPVRLANPAQARKNGIGMVFQDFRLVPALTVLENVALGLPQLPWRLQRQSLRQRLISVAEQYGLEVDPEASVWQLDVGQRQRVEIVKVLLSGARVLLFDEPTSVLAITEVGAFLKMIGRLRDEGYAILFVTHKLQEALACADRVTVLRGGRVAFTSTAIGELDEKTLVTHMIGQWIAPLPAARATPPEGPALLQALDLAVADDHGRVIFQGANLKLNPGEIVGVAGISGNGQRELAEALLGLRLVRSGSLLIEDQNFTHVSPNRFLQAGVVGVPEDPIEEAVVPGLSVLEHMILGGLPERRRGLGINWSAVQADFAQLPEVATLQVPAPSRRADRLSGGNLQRLVLTRALAHQPRVLIACYPSRGLDIATTRAIQNLLLNRRDAGTAILLFSEDLSELYELSDKLVVLTHGQLLGPIDPRTTHAYEVAQWMTSPDSYHQRHLAPRPETEDQLGLQPEYLQPAELSLNISEHV